MTFTEWAASISLATVIARFLPGMSPYLRKPTYDYDKPGIYLAIAGGVTSLAVVISVVVGAFS